MGLQHRLFRRKNGYFYHRVKVPADIRALYGKDIEQMSLGTCDFRLARQILPSVIVAIDERFKSFREQFAEQPKALPVATLPKSTVNKPVTFAAAPVSSALPSISQIGKEAFAEIKAQKSWSPKTEGIRESQLRLFIEICGDKPLASYTQSNVREFKQTLQHLPPSAHSKREFKGLSKGEIATKAKAMGLAGLSKESVRQCMTTVSIVFGWARANFQSDLVNIVQPMIPLPPSNSEKRNSRDGFTIEELNKLFASPLFHGVESSEGWQRHGPVSMKNTGRFWIPLLSLFSGTRLMEAVQLMKEDVACENGIWFLDVNDEGDDKRVKNGISRRRIPIHSELVRLGFLDFVYSRTDGERIFSDIEIGPPKQRHRHASKFFNRLLMSAGIKSKKKVWHSMRHTFEQACRDSAVDAAIMDQLQGHSQKGMRGVYGEGYKLDALDKGLQSIRYVGLNISSR